MAQNPALVQRGLLLLGLMLAIVAVVGFIVFRRTNDAPSPQDSSRPDLAALTVPSAGVGFHGQVNWGALAVLSESLPSSPGWEVRYNAAITLARKGSAKVPLDVLSQMLDEDQQMRNFRVPVADEKLVSDEYAARKTVLNALAAIQEWHKNRDAVMTVGTNNTELLRLYAAVDKLTHSGNDVVRKEAESVKKKVASGVW